MKVECMLGFYFLGPRCSAGSAEHPEYKEKQQRATEGMKENRRVHSDLVPEATCDERRSKCVSVSGITTPPPFPNLNPYRLPPGTSW